MRKNSWLALVYHTIFLIFIMAPLLIIIAVSFTDKGYISLPSNGLSLRWFKAIFEAKEIINSFWLSLGIGLTSASIAIAIAVPASLAIARYDFKGRSAIMAFFMSPLMIPQVVLGVAFLRFFNVVGLSGSFIWLAFAHVIVVLPYALRLVLASATGLGIDAENAARSLGASRWTTFRRITVPLILPGIVGGWMLSFIQSFDELTMTIFVATPGTTTLPVAMYNQITHTIDPLITSVSTVLIIGTLILMVLLDRVVGLDRVLIGKNS